VDLNDAGAEASSLGSYTLARMCGVRADRHALHALDAHRLVPNRDFQRQVPLFILRGGGGEGPVTRKGAHRQLIAQAGRQLAQHRPHIFRCVRVMAGRKSPVPFTAASAALRAGGPACCPPL
jgi:hypothetical protein